MRNRFRLKKEVDDNTIKDIRNLFRLYKENEAVKERVIRDVRIFYEHEEDYCKAARVSNFWSDNYIEYESNGDRNNAPSTEEYLNKIKSYLKKIINDLKKSDIWKIQLTIAINFVSHRVCC